MDRATTLRRGISRNLAVLGSVLVAAMALMSSQGEGWVEESAHVKGQIPDHAIALLTSARADIEDDRGRELADQIIKSQRKQRLAELEGEFGSGSEG